MGMCAAQSGSRFLAFATVAVAVACGGDGGGAAGGDGAYVQEASLVCKDARRDIRRAIAALPAGAGAEIDTEQFAATAHQVSTSYATASERLGGLEPAAADAETAERLAAALAAEAALFDEISAAYAQGDVRRANRISRSEPPSDRVRELAEALGLPACVHLEDG